MTVREHPYTGPRSRELAQGMEFLANRRVDWLTAHLIHVVLSSTDRLIHLHLVVVVKTKGGVDLAQEKVRMLLGQYKQTSLQTREIVLFQIFLSIKTQLDEPFQ